MEMTIITERQIRRALRRIDQQRRSGCFLLIPEERREYARRCMVVILEGTAEQDRADRVRYEPTMRATA